MSAHDPADSPAGETVHPPGFIEAITRSIGEGVYAVDTSGRLTFLNPAAEQLLGWSEAEVLGRSAHDLFHARRADGTPLDSGDCPLIAVVRSGATVRIEDDVFSTREGGLLPVSLTSSPILSSGRVAGAVIAFRDMSHVKNLMREKDAFLAAVSHDLKNPLTTIKALAQMLGRRAGRVAPPDGPRLADGFQRIDRTASRMVGMINELLDVSRLEMGQALDLDRQPVDLVALTARVAADQEQTTDRHRVLIRTELPTLEGVWDAGRLERVLANLLSNAIKYSPDGGEIALTLDRETDPTGEWAIVTIQDHGLGIPSDELPLVFEGFYRGSNVAGQIRGTGLGLAGARRIVEQHGGTIGLESQEGVGTTITVRLPVEGIGSQVSGVSGVGLL